MAREKILVVDDEEDILELLRFNLAREGYRVVLAATAREALALAASERPHLMILDLMLPDMDGLEVARRLRADPSAESMAILMLTAKGEEADVVAGLELGADDYVTKPFSPRVLLARVRALMRRGTRSAKDGEREVLRVHDLVIHPGRHEVLVSGTPVRLTYTEFGILQCLAKRPGWVFTRNQIVDAVRGDDYAVTDRSVDVQIVGLRKKLGQAAGYIETVRGVGYRLREHVEAGGKP